MAQRNRKRKFEDDDENDSKWELSNILNEELREEMATMWEIPQIFHFLHMAKKVLNISHLSMYEMERMLAMPRASKQLAAIMTALLGPPVPKNKVRKVPPMPYDFWVNVLTHKVKGWFKVYESKHHDIVKVFESIGVEPEFWRIVPDVSIIDDKEFDQLSFKQRIWILKTLCDTLMHSRKTIQDEIAKQLNEDTYELVLGADRYGAKFIYFPLFLDNDLRVYRHCIDNTILSTVRPPPWKEGQACSSRPEKLSRSKRKRSRWKNGALPRERRRSKKSYDVEIKMSGDSAIGSSINEDTNFSCTSSCSNNNNIAMESTDRNRSRSPSKTSELSSCLSNETRSSNPKSSGYDTNTSTSDVKSLNEAEPDEMFRGFNSEIDNDNSIDTIGNIHDILNRLTRKVGESVKNEDSTEGPSTPNTNSAIDDVLDEKETGMKDEKEEKKEAEEKEEKGENREREENEDASSSNVIDSKTLDDERPQSRADSTDDDNNFIDYNYRKTRSLDPETFQKEMKIFSGILADLSCSTFELAADSIDSLRDLATRLMTPEINQSGRTPIVPKCEMKLGRAMEDLAQSLQDIEPKLRESTKKARTKLRRELTNFRDGIIEDEDASGDVDCGSNGWIIGSQGSPMLSSSETTLQTLSDPALSPAGSESVADNERRSHDERTDENVDGKVNEDEENSKDVKVDERRVGFESENHGSGENDEDEDSEPQTRRVLRARGISSYTEQLSSDEEEAYELEEWSRVETVNSTPGTSDGTSGFNSFAKSGQIGDESEEKDSDQDWILPGARKRKNKRSPANRRLKTLQQKLSSIASNPCESVANVSPPVPEDADPFPRASTKDPPRTNSAVICKVESIHSELDIKDEAPMYEYNRSTVNPVSLPDTSVTDQNQAFRTADLKPPRPAGPPPPPGMMMQQLPPGYYVQGPQNYYDPRYIRYSYPPANRGGLTYSYQPPPQLHPYASQPPFWQRPDYMPMQSASYPRGVRPPGYPSQRAVPQRHQGPSTTLYGARLPGQLPQNRMPAPRLLSAQHSAIRYPTRPRAPQMQLPPRRYPVPRQSAPTQNPGARAPRPARPAPRPAEVKKPAGKSTSLILLSDSDDEIEMIVPEKKTTTIGQNRRTRVNDKNRPVAATSRQKSRPVVTSQITMSKSNELLSPQMIQRMSQGGISITPVKPAASKEKSGDNSAQGTKLVVVVNETGSHYALALPNGSKLILTPEQVAQIRASNGGKLVL